LLGTPNGSPSHVSGASAATTNAVLANHGGSKGAFAGSKGGATSTHPLTKPDFANAVLQVAIHLCNTRNTSREALPTMAQDIRILGMMPYPSESLG